MKRSLTAVRGLEFTDEVPILVEQKDVIERHLEADLLEDYGEEKLKNISLAYTKLALFPWRVDLKQSLLNFYTAQVVGFYNPKAKRIVLLGESSGEIPPESDLDETVLAHELTHALQDQHFSLRSRLSPSDNDDRTLAFRSLAEGDAILTEFARLFGDVHQWSPAQLNRALQSSREQLQSSLADLPAAIADKLLFPYKVGAAFVYRLLNEKGWAGVNLLYSSPPLSTEQMLHPEKYLDLPDPPIRVDLRDLSLLFPSGWREIENNTLGELMVQCLFKEFFSQEEADVVANGWGGDRFVAFRRGDEVSFIWATVWDSSKDAEEFFEKYQEILSRKYGPSQSSDWQFYVERRDRLVVVVEGLERTHIKNNIEKIFQEIKLEEEPLAPRLSYPSPAAMPSPFDFNSLE